MSVLLTEEQLLDWRSHGVDEVKSMAAELIALRVVWKIVEPHLPTQVYRRALNVIAEPFQ